MPLNEVTFVQKAEDVLSAADGVAALPLWRLMLLGGAAGLTFGLLGYVQAHPGFDRIGAVFGLCIFPVAFQWLRRLKLRGLRGVAEEFTMAAAAQNLILLTRRQAPA